MDEMAYSPLVILGLDAGDPDLIRRWANEGYLPTVHSLMQQGCHGNTVGPEMISEHGIWVSLFTGVSRARHGYYDFRQLNPGTYDLVQWNAKKANALPFWSLLRGTEKKIAVLDAQDVFPISGLNGIQLANWATHEPAFETSADPPELLQEARDIFGPQMHVEVIWNSTYEQDLRVYKQLMQRIEKKGELCRALLKRDRYDLVVVSFGESHTGSHQLWRHRPVAHGGEENELTHSIRELYRAIDGEFEQILSTLPSNANVFLVTSAGMEDHYPTSGLAESFCRLLGYQGSPEPGGFSLHPMSLARRMIPESLRIAISKHFPRETRERLLADQFRNSTDWSKTTAFSLPSFYAGSIRINLKGREPRGFVHPSEYNEFLERLKEDLMQITDPHTEQPALRWLPTSEELFGRGRHEHMPDLFLKWKPHTHYLERVVHPRGDLRQNSEFVRDSGHSDVGFVVAAGPAIQGRGDLGEISLLDLVPTFLTLTGQPIPNSITGTPIRSVLEP